MFRKFVSLVSCVGLLAGLAVTSANGRADSLTASSLSGPNGRVNLYTIATGYSSPQTVTSGWAYFGMADGSWFDGTFSSLSVAVSGKTKTSTAVLLGWLDDAVPCIAYYDCIKSSTGTAISLTIVDYWSGEPYISTGEGSLVSGAVRLSK